MKAVVFIKSLQKSLEGFDQKAKAKATRQGYLRYCSQHGVCNTIQAWRSYRKACRGVFGFDLSVARPQKLITPIETQGELF